MTDNEKVEHDEPKMRLPDNNSEKSSLYGDNGYIGNVETYDPEKDQAGSDKLAGSRKKE